MDELDSNLSNTDEKYVINLWKAFCKSRKALSFEYNATDAVINKWNNRFLILLQLNRLENM
jgi:hypothetical protein